MVRKDAQESSDSQAPDTDVHDFGSNQGKQKHEGEKEIDVSQE